MSNPTAILSAIDELTEGFAAAGKVIDLNQVAISLCGRYPGSGLSTDEVINAIEGECR
jgi:hypothetical protein